jgi:hypothetical protein
MMMISELQLEPDSLELRLESDSPLLDSTLQRDICALLELDDASQITSLAQLSLGKHRQEENYVQCFGLV